MEGAVERSTRIPAASAPEAPLPPRGALGRAFDLAFVAGFVGLWLALAARFVTASSALEVVVSIAVAFVPALLAADLAAGLLHWFADTFFARTTPLIGPTLVHAFRDHHRDPTAIARRGIVEVSGQNCFACVGILLPGLLLDAGSPAGRFALVLLLLFALAIALTNLFHRWAHAERVHPAIAVLQRAGAILSPARHAVHHRGAHDRAFCVTTGWLNAPLDRIGFFGALERAVRRAAPRGGRAPRRLAKPSRAN